MPPPQVNGFVLDQHELDSDTTPDSSSEASRHFLRTKLTDVSVPRRRQPPARRRKSSKSGRRSSRKDLEPSQLNASLNGAATTPQQSSKGTEIQIIELREQLVALKVRNRDLEEELKSVKVKFRKEYEAMQGFEDERVDIQLDLAETKRISSRLEKENDLLRKKAAKREEMNQGLLAQLEKLRAVTGSESSIATLSHDSAGPDDLVPLGPSTPKLTKEERSSIWRLLADEAMPQSHSPITSMDSRGNLLESFFRTSQSLSSFNDMTKSVSSASLNPKNRLSRSSRLHSRVGMPAA